MSHVDLKIARKKIRPHKAFVNPVFNEPTILVSNHFDYVELWLKKKRKTKALPYWQQARNFYDATLSIPIESKPLTAYYCMMNAAKTLLETKGATFGEFHGCSGNTTNQRAHLINEVIEVKSSGIVPALSSYFEASSIAGCSLDLKKILYNIPFVHRAFTATFSNKNLFIPIVDPHFVRQNNGKEVWFTAKITDQQYFDKRLYDNQRGWKLSNNEHNEGENSVLWIRRNKRCRLQSTIMSKEINKRQLLTYHRRIRRDIKYIYGQNSMWYLKRNHKNDDVCNWPIPILVLTAMHRLSELCRYDPKRLARHLDAQHNWLIAEFLNLAPINFIDNISCEITGRNIMDPGYRSSKI